MSRPVPHLWLVSCVVWADGWSPCRAVPCRDVMWTLCIVVAVLWLRVCAVVLRLIRAVITPPAVSIARDRGVTCTSSNNRLESFSDWSWPDCTVALYATASSGYDHSAPCCHLTTHHMYRPHLWWWVVTVPFPCAWCGPCQFAPGFWSAPPSLICTANTLVGPDTACCCSDWCSTAHLSPLLFWYCSGVLQECYLKIYSWLPLDSSHLLRPTLLHTFIPPFITSTITSTVSPF